MNTISSFTCTEAPSYRPGLNKKTVPGGASPTTLPTSSPGRTTTSGEGAAVVVVDSGVVVDGATVTLGLLLGVVVVVLGPLAGVEDAFDVGLVPV
jgi:hypothetical protein